MRSKLLASVVAASALAGGATFAVTGIAGAQGGGQPPAEAGRGGEHGPKLDAAAKALNLSVDDLRSKLRDGKTLAQVAQDQNVDKQKVIDAMVAEATARIDQKVQDGSLTADQANERKSNLQDHITRLVNEGRPKGDHRPKLDAAATALNLSVDDLRSRIQGGKTLAQIAQDQNVDKQKVIDAMVADATAHIDQEVQDGKLTADQANERKSNLNERITKLVNEGRPKDRPGRPGDRNQ